MILTKEELSEIIHKSFYDDGETLGELCETIEIAIIKKIKSKVTPAAAQKIVNILLEIDNAN